MLTVWIYETSFGPIGIGETDGALRHLFFPGTVQPSEGDHARTPLLDEAAKQLSEYFSGARQAFSLPLAPRGPAFSLAVWQALQKIPYGETRSYGAIAAEIGAPKASRAVGMANAHNPLSILIPCHRVVGANGKLTGYAGGLAMKERLLRLEGVL